MEENDDPPYVYVVYYAEDKLYEEKVNDFINQLRVEYGIDARSNLTDERYHTNRQFFVFESLQKADYVLIFCSPSFKQAEKFKLEKETPSSGEN